MRRGEVWWKVILVERVYALRVEEVDAVNKAIKFALGLE